MKPTRMAKAGIIFIVRDVVIQRSGRYFSVQGKR